MKNIHNFMCLCIGELVKKNVFNFSNRPLRTFKRSAAFEYLLYKLKGFNGWCAGTSHPLGSLIHIYKMKTGVYVIH